MSGNNRVPAPQERNERPGEHESIGQSAAETRDSVGSNFGRRRSGQRTGDENAGWVVLSYLVTGMLIYGGLGWLIGHWVGSVSVAMLIGLLVGVALAVTLVIFRFGRS
jgi:ATP synthase protein I